MSVFGYTAEIAKHVTAGEVAAMREWVADCEWCEDADELAELSRVAVVRGVEYHYDGGVNGFIVDMAL